MPAAQELRFNPETGKAHLLTGEGWKEFSGDEARALVEAQREGLPGAIVSSLAENLSMGLLDSPQMEASRELNPGTSNAVTVGMVAPGLIGLGAAGVRGAGRMVMGGERMAQRVAQQAERGASREASGIARQVDDGLGDSAGAAAADNGAGVSGTIRNRLERVFQEFAGSPTDLTTRQRRLLQSGMHQRLGFKLLPGQSTGKNMLLESAKSDPIIGSAFDDVLQGNVRQGNRYARKAIGLDDGEEFGLDELGQAADQLGEQFDAIGDQIGAVTLPPETFHQINSIAKVDADLGALIGQKLGKELDESIEISGQNLMDVRSLINDKVRQDWQLGNALSAQRSELALDAIDDIIEQALGADGSAFYAKIRQQWKVLKELEKPGAVRADGSINSLTVARNARKAFKGYSGRSDVRNEGAGLLPETKDFLDWQKMASSFAGNLGDSGTATRLTLQNILANPNPATLAARFYVRGRLKRQADLLNDQAGTAGQ